MYFTRQWEYILLFTTASWSNGHMDFATIQQTYNKFMSAAFSYNDTDEKGAYVNSAHLGRTMAPVRGIWNA